MSQDELKRQAAERAVELVEDGMKLGLGTGSTARLVLEAIARRRERGQLRDVVGVPTSEDTRSHAERLGIPLATLDDQPRLDLTLDGADEVDPALDLIKGLGGALLREKIVASATDHLVIVVDDSKLVDRLGTKAPLPVEVVPFGWRTAEYGVRAMAAEPTLRRRRDGPSGSQGEPFVTDGGHYILDCAFQDGIDDPAGVEDALRRMPAVVDSGLFIGLASTVVVGSAEGTRVLERAR